MTIDATEACAPNRELLGHTTALRVAAAGFPDLTTPPLELTGRTM